MAKWNPFAKSYDVKCCDGTKKTVYKKVEDAFPLAIAGYEHSISTNLKNEILKEANLDTTFKSKIDGLLFGLDDINNGLMMSFRSAYVGFQTDPCVNNQFLIDQIHLINEEQRRLRALKMQIRGYVELANSNPGDTVKLAENYSDLVHQLGSSSMKAEVAVGAINSAKAVANAMKGEAK